ncbi:MAG: adenosylcobinamide-GDP ribazoletransferase, partial [Christensenellales bacterium]
FCLIPVAATGGIHLDGFADTSDALSSYGDREKKLAILKDPHCGAFAVIRLCGYFVLYFALCACLRFTPRVGAVWTLALVLERALSGYAVATFPMAKNTGLAHTFATAADKRRVQIVLLAVSVCVGAGMALLGGGLLVLAALAALWRYRAVAVKQFGGVTGDLAGWFCSGRSFGCWRRCCFREVAGMIFITGPLYSGKRTFARGSAGRQMADAQELAAGAENLERLADELAAQYDVVMATEIGGGIVPLEAEQRRARRRPVVWPACWRRARTR